MGAVDSEWSQPVRVLGETALNGGAAIAEVNAADPYY